MDSKAILTAAADLCAAGWCAHTSAVNAAGLPVNPKSPEAVAFCMYGAIERVAMTTPGGGYGSSYNHLTNCNKAINLAFENREGAYLFAGQANDAYGQDYAVRLLRFAADTAN